MTNTVQIITAATALAAVLVGPAVSVWVARRQIRASVVSNNRQAWINDLRSSIAEFHAEINLASSIKHGCGHDDNGLQRMKRIMQLNCKIDLLINPEESDHVKLAQLIGEATDAMAEATPSKENTNAEWDKRNRSIVELSQRILKREWVRVKRGS